jgi:hypothetical protein
VDLGVHRVSNDLDQYDGTFNTTMLESDLKAPKCRFCTHDPEMQRNVITPSRYQGTKAHWDIRRQREYRSNRHVRVKHRLDGSSPAEPSSLKAFDNIFVLGVISSEIIGRHNNRSLGNF